MAKRLQQRTFNVIQTSTRRLVLKVARTVLLVASPLTQTLHVLQVLRVDEFLVAVKTLPKVTLLSQKPLR